MTIEATSPNRAMEDQKDAFFFGDVASIDPIFAQYPESLPIHVLLADASSSSSTAPSSPAEVSDPSSCQDDTPPSSAKRVKDCASSDSLAHSRQSQSATVPATTSSDASTQAPSHATVADNCSRTATGAKSKGAISITPSRNTLTFFPPPSNERTHPNTASVRATPVRVDSLHLSPTRKAPDLLRKSPNESIGCISDFAPPTEFRNGDWMCVQSHCSFHNYSRNSMCGRCGALNPSLPSSRPGFAASRARKGGIGSKLDAALPAFNLPPNWSTPTATTMQSPFPNSGWSSATLSPPSAATLADGRNRDNLHQRSTALSPRLFGHDRPNENAVRRRGCDTPYPGVENGAMYTPPLQTGSAHSQGPLDIPQFYHQDRMRESIMHNRVKSHLRGDAYSEGIQQLHRLNVQQRTQSPSPMRPQTNVSAYPMSLLADPQLSSPASFKQRSLSYNSCRSPFATQSPSLPVPLKRNSQSSDSHVRGTPQGARTLFGNGSGIDSEQTRRAQVSLNDLATTQQLASMGVGVGPGVNPNVDYPLSGLAASSDLRSPTIREGPPPPPPIINSGSVGPMLVQAGDWICSHCSFVNWRRRRVCMRCYPFAEGNEIALSLSNGALLAARVAAGVEIPESELASLTKPRSAAHLDNGRTQSEPNGSYAHIPSPRQVMTSPKHIGIQQPPSPLTGVNHAFARSNIAQGVLQDPALSNQSRQTTPNVQFDHAHFARTDIGNRNLDNMSLWQPQAPSAELPRPGYHGHQTRSPPLPAWLPAPISSPGAFGLEARHKHAIPPALGSPSFSSPLRNGGQVPDLFTPSGRAIKDLWKDEAPPMRKSSEDDNLVPISANLRLHFSTTPVREANFDSFTGDARGSLHGVTVGAAQQPLWSRREGQNGLVGRPAPIGTRPATSSSSVSSSAAAATSPLNSSQ
ncbi:hypothetical protein BCV69DRAFT_180132 [Microstroma glucosiphilum]|uniref:RanBP2-type domain-containing protein n=1 Tax=Pseudomicrostroma glucosiphilum TaxID=1684307 RepID=A0A316UD39_9BASI|nr:hypothetical protein BCV69DRAFT_180132 [Pseudomicrostroma glucosiphilum]PWN20965.1 hypothetical protein BCV69DRAFT_180132 [Pseudomicrostroma glucosiphilum]